MTDAAAPMMQIGELADRAEMSLRTIRHYDEVGLLTPSGRSDGGFRLYTDAVAQAANEGRSGNAQARGQDIGSMAEPPVEAALEA